MFQFNTSAYNLFTTNRFIVVLYVRLLKKVAELVSSSVQKNLVAFIGEMQNLLNNLLLQSSTSCRRLYLLPLKGILMQLNVNCAIYCC